jgi:predicted nucleotidyltransferase
MVEVDNIVELAERIVQQFHPERIILFGSYAYGRPTADSDVDLLVILPFEGHPARKAAEIRTSIRAPFPMDLLVRTPQQVQRRVEQGDFFMREIMEKGKVLYEAPDQGVSRQGGG